MPPDAGSLTSTSSIGFCLTVALDDKKHILGKGNKNCQKQPQCECSSLVSCDRVRHLRRGSVLRSKGVSLSGPGLGYDGGEHQMGVMKSVRVQDIFFLGRVLKCDGMKEKRYYLKI